MCGSHSAFYDITVRWHRSKKCFNSYKLAGEKFYSQPNILYNLSANQHVICIFYVYLFPFHFNFNFHNYFPNCTHHNRMLFTVKTVITRMFSIWQYQPPCDHCSCSSSVYFFFVSGSQWTRKELLNESLWSSNESITMLYVRACIEFNLIKLEVTVFP